MAKQRVQVQELDAGSLVVRPTASPVDTYVRPASEQPTLTPLSQFVNAISPAVEAKANEMKTEKLKLERKEEAYKLRMQDAQAKAKMGELTLDISQQYDSNSESFHEKYPNAQLAVEAYNKPVETYLEKLRQDPTVDQSIIQDMEYYAEVNKIAFATTYNTNQLKINRTKVDNNFINQVAKVSEATNKTTEQQVEMIQTLADQMANGFLLPTGKPDYKRFNTLLVNFLDSTRTVNANGAIYEAVSNMVTQDGNYLNILNSADFAEQGARIETARASLLKSGNTARQKQLVNTVTTEAAALALSSGNAALIPLGQDQQVTRVVDGVEVTTTVNFSSAKLKTDVIQLAKKEIVELNNQLLNDNTKSDIEKEAILAEAKRRHFSVYKGLKIDPPEVADMKQNGFALWTTGDMTQPDNVAKAEFLYEQMEEVEDYAGDAGMAQLGFTDDQLNFYAAVKSGVEANEPFFDALNVARQYDPDTAVDPKVTQDDVKKFDDTSWFPFYRGELGNKVTADIVNYGDVTNKINERAKILMATGFGMDREAAIEKATQQILTDYRTIDMPNGQSTLVRAENLADEGKRDESINLVDKTLKDLMVNSEFIQGVSNTYNISTSAATIGVTDLARASIASRAFTIMPRNNLTNQNQLDLYIVETDANGKIDPNGNAYRLPQSINLLNLGENQKQLIIDSVFTKKAEEVDPNLPSLAEDPRMFTTELNDMETMLKEQGGRPLNEALSEVGSAIGNAIGGTVSEATGKIGEVIGSTIESLSQSPTGEVLSEEEIQNKMEETFKDLQGSVEQLNPTKSAIASTIIENEGFKATPYDDMGKQSVGHGLQIESLEPDERALIKDINNVQPEESQAVVALKVDKISNYFSDVVDNFQNLPETAQSAMVQMGYQLGQYNVTKEWTKFMGAVKEAAQYAEGSIEQATALAEAKFHMLYNEAKDGTTRLTKWATQTKDRAFKVASELGFVGKDVQTVEALPKPKPTKPVAKTVKYGESVKNMIPSHMRMFVQDILDINLDTTRTNDFFSKEEFTALQEITRRAMARQGGTKGDIDYDLDYSKGQSDVSFISNSLSIGDPEGAVKKTLGDFTWRVNNKGEVIITDQYNFNDAVKLRKKHDTEIKKVAHLTALAARAASGDEQVGLYGLLRRYGALYGSIDGQGAKFEINLGKL